MYGRVPGWLPLLSAVVVAACAPAAQTEGPAPSSGAGTGSTQDRYVTGVLSDGTGVRYTVEDEVVVYTIDHPPATTWSALVAAFGSIEIDANLVDPANRRVGMQDVVVTRRTRLAGERPSTYLDCGSTLTGPIAEQSRIHTTFLATAAAVDGQTTAVRFEMVAQAVPFDAGDSEARRCRSKRTLEARIIQELFRRLNEG